MTDIQTKGQMAKEMNEDKDAKAQSFTIVNDWHSKHTCYAFEYSLFTPIGVLEYWDLRGHQRYHCLEPYEPVVYLEGECERYDIIENPLGAYCEFLDILDAKGCLDKELAFGGRNHEKCLKMLERWEKEWRILDDYCKDYYERAFSTAFLEAIEGRSREEIQIIANMYPEELTSPKEIALRYIAGENVDSYVKAFPKEFFETIKSENLLYAIFWMEGVERVLNFVQSALEYDKDYFRNYRDEVGNTSLHLYLMRFELLHNGLKSRKISHEIRSLLLAGGVSVETPNDGGVSYKELHSHVKMYRKFSFEKPPYARHSYYGSGWVEWIISTLDGDSSSRYWDAAVDMAIALKLKHPSITAFKEYIQGCWHLGKENMEKKAAEQEITRMAKEDAMTVDVEEIYFKQDMHAFKSRRYSKSHGRRKRG